MTQARRRRAQPAVAAWLAVVLVLLGGASGWYAVRRQSTPLLQAFVLTRDAGRDAAWLAEGTVPGAGTPWSDAVRSALLDLDALTDPATGAVLAAPRSSWRYVWPRDAAFVAVALARTGHVDRARAVLLFLQRVQRDDGLLAARYRPDGTEPDDRGVQLDGTGWALWALEEVVRAAPAADRAGLLVALHPLLDRSSRAAAALVASPTGLPPASMDYWELPTRSVTLGTAAPLLAGLEAATRTWRSAGDAARAQESARAATRLRSAMAARFGVFGWPRVPGGRALDAAVAMLLPPFLDRAPRGAETAWRRAQEVMRAAGGGLVPGERWPRDGISWTPTVGLFALTAAATHDRRTAAAWLAWLAAHRTTAGSLPEKVLHDGTPASVAPLAWTSALVVLAAAELDSGTTGSARPSGIP